MENDFQPVVGHKFNFRATPMPHWNGVTDCQVLIVEPNERFSHSWNASGQEAAKGLRTVVTWTLTPTRVGTPVRMEQSGFRPEEEANYRGANYGWQRVLVSARRSSICPRVARFLRIAGRPFVLAAGAVNPQFLFARKSAPGRGDLFALAVSHQRGCR